MTWRVVPLFGLLAALVLAVFWIQRPKPEPEPPREPTASDLVEALAKGDDAAFPKLLAMGPDGIAALESSLARSDRGILEILRKDDQQRDRLIAALAEFKNPAEPALARLLGTLSGKTREIAQALARTGVDDPLTVAALLLELDTPGDEVPAALATAGAKAMPGLLDALKDEARCEGAVLTLKKLGATAEIQAALAPGAPSESRAAAARALSDARDPQARDALLALLSGDEDDDLVRAAASALMALGEIDPVLERTRPLFDKTPVFDAALEQKCIAFLLRAAADEELEDESFEAFARLGPLPPEGVALAKKALSGGARGAAAEALGNGCDDPEVPPVLLKLAKEDKDPYVRIDAGLAYARLTGDANEVIPILVAELPRKADLHHLVGSMKQNAASKALARIGAPAVPALVEALASDDDFARDQAATALYDIGEPVRASEPRLREIAASGKEQAKRVLDSLAAKKE